MPTISSAENPNMFSGNDAKCFGQHWVKEDPSQPPGHRWSSVQFGGRHVVAVRAAMAQRLQIEEIERAPQMSIPDVKFFAEAKKERHDDGSCILLVSYGMAERWDSHHCRWLKTKNLRDSWFLTIRWNRMKCLVETHIEHVECHPRRRTERSVEHAPPDGLQRMLIRVSF